MEHLDILHSYCDIRYFNFSKYPSHVHRLGTYAWKPLIINEIFSEGDAEVILWSDSSTRLQRSLIPVFPQLSRFPIVPGEVGLRPFVSMVQDGILDYFNLKKTRKEYASIQTSLNANVILFWLNYALTDNFLDLWADCALREECIAPNGAVVYPCKWTGMRIGSYACHRFDQAAYNSILAREFGFDFM